MTAETAAANRMRSVPHSRSAISIVSGMPRPMPYGVRMTYFERNSASLRGLISSTRYERPCVIATIFSVTKKRSPGCDDVRRRTRG